MADVAMDSDSGGSEFEGFDEDDLPLATLRDRERGSDIEFSSESDDSSSDESDSDESDDEPAMWTRNLRAPHNEAFTQHVGATFVLSADKTEIDFFAKFFTDELIDLIVKETNEYAERCILQKPDKLWKPVSAAEIRAFLGMHVIMSVIQVPAYTVAWTQKWPFSLPSVPEIMQRTRFEKISKYFHCNNVENNPPRRQPGHDKLCHIRPVIDKLVTLCLSNYDPPIEQSVDEGMIAFKGRLSFKQYLPAKPTKFGIKVWERAAPLNGYCHEFQIYTGKQDQIGNERREEGLGARVVKDLTRNITGNGHHVFVDNFFSSPQLFEDLYEEKIYACGTVRANRKGMPQAIKGCRLREKGEYRIMQKDNLVAWAWRDKKTVFYLSTNCDPTVENTVQRRQKDGTQKDIPCPSVAQSYNRFMFGVDRADQLRMHYSTCRKALKWWKYIFWFCFDLAVVNSFICMKESVNHKMTSRTGREKNRTQMDFRMQLARQLIGDYRASRKRKAVSNVDNCGNSHWPVRAEKRSKCKLCHIEKRRHEVFIRCNQCQIYLCVDKGCFKKWHEQHMN